MRRARIAASIIAGAASICLASASIASASFGPATTYTVTGTADGVGSCTGTSCTTLRAAVQETDSHPGSTIDLGTAEYLLAGNQLYLNQPTTLVGEGPAMSVIKQTGPDRVLQAIGGPAKIEGVTLTGGLVEGVDGSAGKEGESATGGGVLASDGLTLIDDAIVGNRVVGGEGGASSTGDGGDGGYATGGGVDVGGALTIADSTFAGNFTESGDGGGAFGATGDGGDSNNSDGSAIFVAGELSIRGSAITGNTNLGGKGGISLHNSAGYPGNAFGTIATQDDPASIVNSTIAGNSATVHSADAAEAGLEPFTTHLELTLASDTFAGNVAEGARPAGLNVANLLFEESTLNFADTILEAGDGVKNCAFTDETTVHSFRPNLESDAGGSCHLSAAGGDLIGADPRLEALAANGGPTQTMALQPGSPALGAGGQCLDISIAGSTPLSVDQRGLPRANPCDIGAWEAQPSPAPPSPQISAARLSHKVWREGSSKASISRAGRKKLPVGTTISFKLNESAKVIYVFRSTGRSPRTATLEHAGHAGLNKLSFAGRLGHRKLSPGRYSLRISAVNAASATSNTATLKFKIAGGRRRAAAG